HATNLIGSFGSMTAPGVARPKRRWKMIGILAVVAIVLLPILYIVARAGITLSYTYSQGERAGFVQKFSQKGWVCKTWEGEMAQTTQPGVPPLIWDFTVKSDPLATV